ncbi:uncharacterized protein LOC126892961 [Diabrotica virgifera virgifera]|uniref:Uncharacterized protein n=1 Tax=Diabrotica virgifera virgifera TaxID=50390 RepID=A0ABM5L8U7_DIAVI|nr:uncharacterized protein LOC126892961 [Diabrotica virgifera virgifera]
MALSCKVIVAAVFVVFFCVITECTTLNGLWVEHKDNNSKMLCGDPQPRAVYGKEIFSKDLWNKEYKKYKKWIPKMNPPYTILHRCEGSGGCSEDNKDKNNKRRCQVNGMNTVWKVFRFGNGTLESLPVVNHTSCMCG